MCLRKFVSFEIMSYKVNIILQYPIAQHRICANEIQKVELIFILSSSCSTYPVCNLIFFLSLILPSK